MTVQTSRTARSWAGFQPFDGDTRFFFCAFSSARGAVQRSDWHSDGRADESPIGHEAMGRV